MFIDDLNNFKVSAASPFAVAATAVTTDAMDVGPGGVAYNTLWLAAYLTTAFSAGQLNTITVQTAVDAAFTSPITLQVDTIPAAVDQTKAAELWTQRLPLNHLRYVRLIFTPSGTGAGAQIMAMLTEEVPHR